MATRSIAAAPGRRLARTGTLLIALGVAVLAWAAVTLVAGDPLTAAYARHEQAGLRRAFADELARYRPPAVSATAGSTSGPTAATRLAGEAQRFARAVAPGQAFGRLVVPRLGLDVVVVQGTAWWADLRRGPGHYTDSAVPGAGRTVAIAGHRTTFGAWFRHIDDLRPGDPIELQMPYATFRYRVTGHVVSDNDDRGRLLAPQGYERLMLSACHPLYSASQRWVVFARASSATLRDGRRVRLRELRPT